MAAWYVSDADILCEGYPGSKSDEVKQRQPWLVSEIGEGGEAFA